MTINETTTFGELLGIINGNKAIWTEDRLPSEKQLLESDLPILVKTNIGEAEITIYENGLLIYSEGKYSTVCTVARCANVGFEVTEDTSPDGRCGKYNHTNTVDKAEVMGWNWYYPIMVVCGERLDHNSTERENSHIAYHTNGDGEDWYGSDTDDEESYCVKKESKQLRDYNNEVSDREFEEWKLEKLALIAEKKALLTERQRQVIELYYGLPDATEQKVADILSARDGSPITQQGVDSILKQALKKMRKNIGC